MTNSKNISKMSWYECHEEIANYHRQGFAHLPINERRAILRRMHELTKRMDEIEAANPIY